MRRWQGAGMGSALAILVASTGCGGAAPAPPASKRADEPVSAESVESSTEAEAGDPGDGATLGADSEELARLEGQLADAERALVTSLPAAPDDVAQPSAPPPAKGGAAPQAKPSAARPAATSASAPTGGSATPDCATSCKALSSMRRSRDRICELAGATDDRCTTAGARVRNAEERVARAPCACND